MNRLIRESKIAGVACRDNPPPERWSAKKVELRVCAWAPVILFTVLASVPAVARQESWVEVRSPHFRVYSDAGEKRAVRITHEFEKFHALIQMFLPSAQAGPGNPTIVLAAENERTLRSLIPQYWEERGKARPSGIFVGGPEKNYVALRVDLEDDHRYHVVYHEYVHLLLRLNYPRLPVWLSEGLAECLGYTAINGETSRVGEPSPERIRILRSEPLIPLAELFSVDHESSHYRDEAKVPMFYAQSWALTHMLILGEKRAHMHRLMEFLELLRQGSPVADATEQALGDPGELERQLNEYILNLAFYAFEVKTPSAAGPDEFSTRTVRSLEMQALRGDFYVSMQLWPEAKQTLDSVLASDPENAEALTSMGIFYARQNRMKEAAEFFVAAAGAGSESCITHYHAGGAAMQSGDYAEAEKSFRRAVELNPEFAPGYSQLASVMAAREVSLEAALEFARKAIELEPGVLNHQLVMAHVLLRMNKVDLAIRYGEQVEESAESNGERMEAEKFLSMARRFRNTGLRSGLPEDETNQAAPADQAGSQMKEAADRESQESGQRRLYGETGDGREKRNPMEKDYLGAVRRAGSGEEVSLQGIVSNVYCFDPAGMELVLDSGEDSRRLHVADYYRIKFTARGHNTREMLEPCTDLPGAEVVIDYIATPGAAYTGEVQAIEIHRSEAKGNPRETPFP